ncbi:MAG: RodZ domain-containing protein [Thermodesulfobacteriota bacterium]
MTTTPENPEPQADAVPATTESLGSLLRRARQGKRVALEVAAKDTRIHATTLKALEEDNRGELPAEVFTRGFIKIYAQYLGLNPDEALRMYLEHRGEKTAIPNEKVNAQEVLAGEAMAEPPSFHAERHLFTIAVVVLIALILYMGYKITAPPPPPAVPETPRIAEFPPQPSPAPEAMVPAEQIGQMETAPAETLPAATPEQAPAAVPPPGPVPAAAPQTLALQPPRQATPAAPQPQSAPAAAVPPSVVKTPQPAPQAAALPKTATPASATAKTALPAAPPVPPAATAAAPARTAPVAAQPPAAAPTTMPQATTAAKPPLKELAPPGPIKKEKTGPAVSTATAQTEKPEREPNTAEKLIAAIKPMRPPYALEATFREDTWVRIQVDGEKPKPQYFRAGDKASWQASSKIQLFIGNAGGVDLTLNNTKLPPLGKPGNTTRISIQPQPDQR